MIWLIPGYYFYLQNKHNGSTTTSEEEWTAQTNKKQNRDIGWDEMVEKHVI